MQSTPRPVFLRIGTRGSPLALWQAEETRARLAAAHGVDTAEIEILPIKTTGDRIQDRSLSEAGGKGLFTKEIEEALIEGRIDLAVHSAKDMPTVLPAGLSLAAYLPREDMRDAFLSPVAERLVDLPKGAILGTSSLRRKAMALRLRPDLTVVEFRGNVETRLRKLAEGIAHATLLAVAGLKRLDLVAHAQSFIETDDFLPAVGQGAVAIEARDDDERTRGLLAAIADRDTAIALETERAFLRRLDGSCRTPIGGLARVDGERVHFRGIVVAPDGSRAEETVRDGAAVDAARLGDEAGAELLARGGRFFQGG